MELNIRGTKEQQTEKETPQKKRMEQVYLNSSSGALQEEQSGGEALSEGKKELLKPLPYRGDIGMILHPVRVADSGVRMRICNANLKRMEKLGIAERRSSIVSTCSIQAVLREWSNGAVIKGGRGEQELELQDPQEEDEREREKEGKEEEEQERSEKEKEKKEKEAKGIVEVKGIEQYVPRESQVTRFLYNESKVVGTEPLPTVHVVSVIDIPINERGSYNIQNGSENTTTNVKQQIENQIHGQSYTYRNWRQSIDVHDVITLTLILLMMMELLFYLYHMK